MSWYPARSLRRAFYNPAATDNETVYCQYIDPFGSHMNKVNLKRCLIFDSIEAEHQ